MLPAGGLHAKSTNTIADGWSQFYTDAHTYEYTYANKYTNSDEYIPPDLHIHTCRYTYDNTNANQYTYTDAAGLSD